MRTILITGGHAGLGLESARTLAGEFGANLVLAGRDTARMEPAAGELRKRYGVRVDTLVLDLSSLASVRAGAAAYRTTLGAGRLDALVLNAGAQFMGPISYTMDGYEETFAVNCLGSFLLLNLLLDCIADDGRVVFTASGTHDPDSMDGKFVGAAAEPDARALAEQGKQGKALSGGRRYTSSKLCTMLYSYELARKLRKTSMASIAFDPGFIPETGLSRTAPKLLVAAVRTAPAKWLSRTLGVTMGSLPFSGQAQARVAADPSFATVSGKYFHAHDGRLVEARSSKMSYDEERAAKLWMESEQLVHLRAEERPRRLL